MQRLSTVLPALLASVVTTSAIAQESLTYDRVDLSASAQTEIENDLLVAVVYAEVQANDQADAANSVNEAITWAIDKSRDARDVELQTMRYSTRPVYANDRRIVGWVARQSLRLQATDQEALSDLLGELQERVALESLRYGLSKSVRDSAEEELIGQAIEQFNRRAELVASRLGRPDFRLVHLSIGTAPGVRPLEQRQIAFASAADVAAPEIEAGTQTVSVTVNGTIELGSRR
jgi:predicted secreted protein